MCFWIIWPNRCNKIYKRTGSSIQTPQGVAANEMEESPNKSLKDLFDIYEENQFKAEPGTTTHLLNL